MMELQSGAPDYIVVSFLILVTSLVGCLLYGYNLLLKRTRDRFRRKRVLLLFSLILGWLIFISYLSTRHILDQFSVLPPRMGLVLFPPLITVVLLANNKRIGRLLSFAPQHWFVFIHSFRIITGILFYLLYLRYVIPVQMTFMGKNFDIVIGLMAPVIGILCLKGKIQPWLLTLWHFTGVTLLSIVVITAVLSAPFPFRLFQTHETNTMIAYFPFVMMPGFVIPVGVLFHLFGLKKSLMHITDASKKLNDRWIRHIGIPLVALLMAGVMRFEFHAFSADFFFAFIVAFGFTILLWHGDRLIITRMRQEYPEYHQTMKRILLQFLFIDLFTIVTVVMIDCFLYIYVFHEIPSLRILLTDIGVGKIISGIMLIIYESIYFFSSWKQNILEVENLKSVQVQNKLDVLKNRLNPHFLFNSLNSLTSLVENDSAGGLDFVQKMADVYRYILQSNESELNSVAAEKAFIEKYFYLLKVRYPDSLFYDISLSETYNDHRLIQLSLQMLIDNAIKHNVISGARPLCISIFIDKEQNLIVSNNLQRKQQLLKTGNFGLSELQKQYENFGMFTMKKNQTDQFFSVSLPLIPSYK
jgi:two-component system LytT family sensor kinase